MCDVLHYAYLCGGSMGQHVLAIGIPDAVQPFHRSLISFLTDDLHLLIHLEIKSNRKSIKDNLWLEKILNTCTKPLSVSIPATSRPNPIVLGTLPVCIYDEFNLCRLGLTSVCGSSMCLWPQGRRPLPESPHALWSLRQSS